MMRMITDKYRHVGHARGYATKFFAPVTRFQ